MERHDKNNLITGIEQGKIPMVSLSPNSFEGAEGEKPTRRDERAKDGSGSLRALFAFLALLSRFP